MLTDYILTQLMVFVHNHLDLIQLMFVELLLSSASDPAEVHHEKTATLLTGSVDYAIMSSVDGRATLAKNFTPSKCHVSSYGPVTGLISHPQSYVQTGVLI